MKRTPLKRSLKAIASIGRRGKRMAVGDRRVSRMAARGAKCEVKDLLPLVPCFGKPTPHHKQKRNRLEARHDPENIVICCVGHHSWIESHPNESRKLGLRIDSKSNLL